MSATVSVLPIWKQGESVTAADRFDELAALARSDPSQFEAVCVVWKYPISETQFSTKFLRYGCDAISAVGILECGKRDFMNECES